MLRVQENDAMRAKLAEQHAEELKAMSAAAAKMQDAMIKAKQKAMRNQMKPVRGMNRKMNPRSKRKFQQNASDFSVDIQGEIELPDISKGIAQMTTTKKRISTKAEKTKKKHSIKLTKGQPRPASVNTVGDEDLPAPQHDPIDIFLTSDTLAPLKPVTNPMATRKAKKRRSTFRQHVTGKGEFYYEDTETGKTVWDMPKDAIVVNEKL